MSLDAIRAAFDAAAPTYDADFTGTVIGRLQRDALHRHLDLLFPPGARILDLGCGAGEDAVHFARRAVNVHGIDLSPAMVETARQRACREGLSDTVRFETLPIERLRDFPECGYAGAFSSFGPLNCVCDLRPVAKALAERLRPGAPVALCFMNRFCLWETLFYLLTLRLHKAIRRFSGAGAEASVGRRGGFVVYYPSVGEVRRTFCPEFAFERAPGIGVFVPPTYLEPFANRFPTVMRCFAGMDHALAHMPGFRSLADHRLIILTRR